MIVFIIKYVIPIYSSMFLDSLLLSLISKHTGDLINFFILLFHLERYNTTVGYLWWYIVNLTDIIGWYKFNNSNLVEEEKWGQLSPNNGCLTEPNKCNNLIKEIYARSNQVINIVTW